MSRLRIHCNSCETETWHEVVASHNQNRYDAFWGYSQDLNSEILRCCGCDYLTFRLVIHPFEFQKGKGRPEEHLYPDRNFTKRKKKFLPMPINVARLYEETVAAHDAKLVLLAAAGLRSLLEAIVADKIDKKKYGNSIESKINALSGMFEPGVLAVLHEFRDMGNRAIHAQVESDHLDLHRALNVVEGVMEYFYGLMDRAVLFQRFRKTNTESGSKDVDI